MKFRYKNIGTVTKEFHGVSFAPGDVREVEGYINCPTFVRVNDPLTKDTAKVATAPVKPVDKPADKTSKVEPTPAEDKSTTKESK